MRKIAKTCEGCQQPIRAGCQQPIRARYRTLVDRYLCDPCWVQAQTEPEGQGTELGADDATEAIRRAFEEQWESKP